MNARHLIPLAILAAACPGGTKTTTDTPEPETTPTGDTGGGPEPEEPFTPFVAFMEASFTWDAATQGLVSLNLGGGNYLPSYIEVVIGSREYAYAPAGVDPATLADEFCVVDFIFADGPAALSSRFIDDPTNFMLVDHSGDVADVLTNCDPTAFPMDEWLGAGVDVVDTLLNAAGEPWALGVGTMSPTATADLQAVVDAADAAELEALWVGGRVLNSSFFFSDVIVDDGWLARPFDIDPTTFEPLVDGDNYLIYIPKDDVFAGNALHTGWYDMFPIYGVLL